MTILTWTIAFDGNKFPQRERGRDLGMEEDSKGITGVKISHIGSGSVIMVLRNVARGFHGFQQECSKSSTYRPSSWELSKMSTCVPSVSGMSDIAACPLSPIADDPSAWPSPPPRAPPSVILLACSLHVSPCVPNVVLTTVVFKVLYCKI